MSIASAEEYAKGDVDMDGVITGRDAAIVSQYADGILQLELNDEQLALADMNDDGDVDASDAALIAEKQEYKFGDFNKDGIVSMADVTTLAHMAFLRMIDPEIDFGEKNTYADIDFDGDIDVYDMHCVGAYYGRQGANIPYFDENKFYIIITPEMEQFELDPEYNIYVSWHPEIKTLQEYYYSTWKIKDYLDVNGDDQVTVSDATAILQTYAENAAGTGLYKAAAYDKMDVNLDGVIDIEDATLILKAYAMDAASLL